MNPDIHTYIQNGLSPAEAIDYYYVEVRGWTQTQWAEERGIGQSSVCQNVQQAKDKLRREQVGKGDSYRYIKQ